MIVWRGWGVLGVAYVALGLALMFPFQSALAEGHDAALEIGAAMLFAALPCWFTGVFLNKKRPLRALTQWEHARCEALELDAQYNTFSVANADRSVAGGLDGQPDATDSSEQERLAVWKQLSNHHTLFFVPLQYWAFVCAALGLLFLGIALTSGTL